MSADKQTNSVADAQHALERFQEIQNAYEILTDPQERSWYDSHIDRTFRKKQDRSDGSENPPDGFDFEVLDYFTSSCYFGFDDGVRGFYTVYSSLFHHIACLESNNGQEKPEISAYPEFGKSDLDWEGVKKFYTEWESFVTKLDFTWVKVYNVNDFIGRDRKVRRVMQQANDKARKIARREYNENVRALVAFVKKRDKRFIAHQASVRAKQLEEMQLEEERRKKSEEAKRLASATEKKLQFEESEQPDLIDESYDVWFCPACNKYFKSEGSMANHEKSRKHKEAVEILLEELRLVDD